VHDDRGFPKRRTRGVILRERKRRERRKGVMRRGGGKGGTEGGSVREIGKKRGI
jgi:hypothetical protein